jgi:PAS domain S-box-containing protein
MPSFIGTDRKSYVIGVIGETAHLHSLLPILQDNQAPSVLSKIGLSAVTALGGDAAPQLVLDGRDIPVYREYRAMLEAHPELDMLIELTGRPDLVSELRRELPADVSLVERDAASLFLNMLASDELWVACKMDLLQAQTLLKAVIDQMSDDILFMDRDGYAVDINIHLSRTTGKTREELLGLHFRDVFRMDEAICSPEEGECPFQQALRTKKAAEARCSLLDAQGRMQYFRIYCYPIRDDQGEVVHFVAMRRDITQRTEMEMRLQQSEKLAAIGELSTYIAHEIRNPLFAISGFANSLLRLKGLSEAGREKVQVILEESKRLDNILKSILNFSRPTQAASGAVDVNEAATSVMELMQIGCDQQNVNVSMELSPTAAKASADAELVKQCLINLVKNAMEAMPDGGALHVRTAMERDYVLLEVKDTGPGISPDILDKIFNPFFSTKGKGAGLGLAMVKKIMDDIGGELDLKNRPGEGVKVTLRLPPLLAVNQPEDQGAAE